MKRCPICNRTYTDESLNFCADDGTQLVGAEAGGAPATPPSELPTMIAPQQFTPTPPAAAPYQPAPKKRKWLALIALLLGLFALPFLLYSLSGPLFWEIRFRQAAIPTLFIGLWGISTVFGSFLAILSLIVCAIAIVLAIKQPTRYGGKALAVPGPLLSVLLMVLVVGAFGFRRMQGPIDFDFSSSNSNYNSNDNSNRSDNYNSSSNSNSGDDDISNSNSADSSADSTGMSETDKYRLFYAATKSGDLDLQRRAARKIGIVDSSGMPTSTYQSFVKGTVNWAMSDRVWVQSMDTTAKGRAYAEQRLGTAP